jgi:hypothetical protein
MRTALSALCMRRPQCCSAAAATDAYCERLCTISRFRALNSDATAASYGSGYPERALHNKCHFDLISPMFVARSSEWNGAKQPSTRVHAKIAKDHQNALSNKRLYMHKKIYPDVVQLDAGKAARRWLLMQVQWEDVSCPWGECFAMTKVMHMQRQSAYSKFIMHKK